MFRSLQKDKFQKWISELWLSEKWILIRISWKPRGLFRKKKSTFHSSFICALVNTVLVLVHLNTSGIYICLVYIFMILIVVFHQYIPNAFQIRLPCKWWKTPKGILLRKAYISSHTRTHAQPHTHTHAYSLSLSLSLSLSRSISHRHPCKHIYACVIVKESEGIYK